MYVAIVSFVDLHDGCRAYRPGDPYPRAGLQVSEERLAALAGSGNRQGRPVIRAEPEAEATTAGTAKPARRRAKKREQHD